MGLIARTDVGAAGTAFVAVTRDCRTIPNRAVNGIFDFGLLAIIDFMTAFERTTCGGFGGFGGRGVPCAAADDAERTSAAAPIIAIRMVMALY